VLQQPSSPPKRAGVVALEAHVTELCDRHRIELSGTSRRGRAIRWRGGRRQIAIPEIRGQVSYFVALHEIGHLVGAGRSAPRLEAEANAWLWALREAAVEPTPATRRSISNRLHGYLEWAQNRQYRRVPPRIPAPEHCFWRLLEAGAA
jgi:hypothetical protein